MLVVASRTLVGHRMVLRDCNGCTVDIFRYAYDLSLSDGEMRDTFLGVAHSAL